MAEADQEPDQESTPPAGPAPDLEPLDTHYEVALDDEPEPARDPVYVDVVTREHQFRPIVPATFRRGNLRPAVRQLVGRTGHRAAYHSLRLPRYLLLGSMWAFVGVGRVIGWQVRWWWHPELSALLQHAATTHDLQEGKRYHAKLSAARVYRGWVLLGELVALAVAGTVLALVAPGWIQALVVAIAVPFLARAGRPIDRRIIEPAVVVPRYRLINSDVVLKAYYDAGLGRPDKPEQRIQFETPMAREGAGSAVGVILPSSGTFADVIKAKEKLASGLDVKVQQVFLKPGASERRHRIWIADQDPLAIPAGRTPLLDCKPRDIWQPAPFGLDERGRRVTILMLWISILIGAQPRKGKTFSARLLALFAALDPYVRLTIADGKDAPDWKRFKLVAHRIIMGTHPNPFSPDPIGELLDALHEIKRHIQEVNAFLSTLPASECPEGKLTRELSRKYPHCRVWLLVMEEFQMYFETEDQEVNKEIAGLLSFIMAVGPSAGVILLSSTQKPSGVGAGDVQRLFNRYRDNHTVRFALKCGNRTVSEAILGGDAYSEGYDASSLPLGLEYRGVGYLYGLSDDTPTVRTHLAEHPDAERILIAARRHREAAGTLTGIAAGEDMAREVRDVLRDVESVYHAGEAWVSWQQLAARLAENLPEHYADITPDAISAQVRALGAAAKKGRQGEATLWGVPRGHVELAIQRREIEARR
jgi:DNA segregation ATPase FtsK/SpoIIIE, S-DNA-T family